MRLFEIRFKLCRALFKLKLAEFKARLRLSLVCGFQGVLNQFRRIFSLDQHEFQPWLEEGFLQFKTR